MGRVLVVQPVKDEVNAAWNKARIRRGAGDGVRLPRSGATVREHSGMKAVDGVNHERAALLKDFHLRGGAIEDSVKLKLVCGHLARAMQSPHVGS